jgi:predicted Fe-Mo cluster-binding NifX family protein
VKIAFTTSGESLEAQLDPRFGRALRFLIYDMDSNHYELLENEKNLNAPQGAGIQAAETVARAGVNCLVTGNCGPKAFQALTAAGIRIYRSDAVTVAEALEAFTEGSLQATQSANVAGHWV